MWKNKLAKLLTVTVFFTILAWVVRKALFFFQFTFFGVSIPIEDGELKAMYMLAAGIVGIFIAIVQEIIEDFKMSYYVPKTPKPLSPLYLPPYPIWRLARSFDNIVYIFKTVRYYLYWSRDVLFYRWVGWGRGWAWRVNGKCYDIFDQYLICKQKASYSTRHAFLYQVMYWSYQGPKITVMVLLGVEMFRYHHIHWASALGILVFFYYISLKIGRYLAGMYFHHIIRALPNPYRGKGQSREKEINN
jgi:hypothetical protein